MHKASAGRFPSIEKGQTCGITEDQRLVSNPHEPREQPSRGSKDASMHKASAGRFPSIEEAQTWQDY
jgi:hypothetical protein